MVPLTDSDVMVALPETEIPRRSRRACCSPAAKESPVILIGVSGSGQLDLPTYAGFLVDTMMDA